MMNIKNSILVFSAFSIFQATIAAPEAYAQGGSCAKKVIEKCQAGGRAAGATDAVAVGGAAPSANMASAETGAAAARTKEAANQCRDLESECAKCPQEEQEQCKQGLGDSAGQLDAQSASMGDASAAMGAIAGLAGALLPMLMQKKEEEEQQNEGALLPSGQLDCSKKDAFMYQACNDMLAASCKTAMSDPRCMTFANRFCAGASTGFAPPGAGRVAVSVPGEGRGSQYCNTVAAYNYCSPGGRDNCPSCLQLQKESSPACVENPALCIAENSAAELAKAKVSCPGDPIFLNPQFSTVGNGAPVTVPVGGAVGGAGGAPPGFAPNPNLPPPVLASVGANAVSPSAGLQMGREAYRANATARASGSVGGSAVGRSAAQSASGDGRGDRMAASNNSYVRGPASDVAGPFAPSLFATSTQLIRSHCAAGRFLNCP